MSENKYEDIINMPHHVSTRHMHMSMYDRSAQFAPYAALTGYGDEVKETARLTDDWMDIDADVKAYLDENLKIIASKIESRPKISVTYFIKDSKKDGGEYTNIIGNLRRIDEVNQLLILENGLEIKISSIIDLVES